MSELSYIPTREADIKFEEHLLIENNNRILFSAKFGDGKTTFLRKFFESHQENFEAIHLFPVSYSVATNEDIFELIKFDILFQLLGNKKIEFEKADTTLRKFAINYAKKNPKELVKLFTPFLKAIPQLGASIAQSTELIIDGVNDFVKEFKEDKEGEIDKIENYLETFTEKQGSIYEEDFYTQLISELVERLSILNVKVKEKPRKTVLILDDLDRIDPEHIFRILNIFAAHQDHHAGNKFGFDKIIVVADIDNIRTIFHHKYGTNCDFTGYIDKFYSNDVFKYSMKEILVVHLINIIYKASGNDYFKSLMLNSSDNIIPTELTDLLKIFIQNDIINVRNVIKIKTITFNMPKYKLRFKEYANTHLRAILIFNMLKTIFGDYHELNLAFTKLQKAESINNSFSQPIVDRFNLIYLPISMFINFNDKKGAINYKSTIQNDTVHIENELKEVRDDQFQYSFFRSEITKPEMGNPQNVNMNELYYELYTKSLQRGFLM